MRKETKAERAARLYAALAELGFSFQESSQLVRIERTLQRWGELECGTDRGAVERDEATGRPWFRTSDGNYRWPVADREAGAKRRLAKLLAEHPGLVAYHQTDCRGCNLYLLHADQVKPGESVDSVYTRGVAVCY